MICLWKWIFCNINLIFFGCSDGYGFEMKLRGCCGIGGFVYECIGFSGLGLGLGL